MGANNTNWIIGIIIVGTLLSTLIYYFSLNKQPIYILTILGLISLIKIFLWGRGIDLGNKSTSTQAVIAIICAVLSLILTPIFFYFKNPYLNSFIISFLGTGYIFLIMTANSLLKALP